MAHFFHLMASRHIPSTSCSSTVHLHSSLSHALANMPVSRETLLECDTWAAVQRHKQQSAYKKLHSSYTSWLGRRKKQSAALRNVRYTAELDRKKKNLSLFWPGYRRHIHGLPPDPADPYDLAAFSATPSASRQQSVAHDSEGEEDEEDEEEEEIGAERETSEEENDAAQQNNDEAGEEDEDVSCEDSGEERQECRRQDPGQARQRILELEHRLDAMEADRGRLEQELKERSSEVCDSLRDFLALDRAAQYFYLHWPQWRIIVDKVQVSRLSREDIIKRHGLNSGTTWSDIAAHNRNWRIIEVDHVLHDPSASGQTTRWTGKDTLSVTWHGTGENVLVICRDRWIKDSHNWTALWYSPDLDTHLSAYRRAQLRTAAEELKRTSALISYSTRQLLFSLRCQASATQRIAFWKAEAQRAAHQLYQRSSGLACGNVIDTCLSSFPHDGRWTPWVKFKLCEAWTKLPAACDTPPQYKQMVAMTAEKLCDLDGPMDAPPSDTVPCGHVPISAPATCPTSADSHNSTNESGQWCAEDELRRAVQRLAHDRAFAEIVDLTLGSLPTEGYWTPWIKYAMCEAWKNLPPARNSPPSHTDTVVLNADHLRESSRDGLPNVRPSDACPARCVPIVDPAATSRALTPRLNSNTVKRRYVDMSVPPSKRDRSNTVPRPVEAPITALDDAVESDRTPLQPTARATEVTDKQLGSQGRPPAPSQAAAERSKTGRWTIENIQHVASQVLIRLFTKLTTVLKVIADGRCSVAAVLLALSLLDDNHFDTAAKDKIDQARRLLGRDMTKSWKNHEWIRQVPSALRMHHIREQNGKVVQSSFDSIRLLLEEAPPTTWLDHTVFYIASRMYKVGIYVLQLDFLDDHAQPVVSCRRIGTDSNFDQHIVIVHTRVPRIKYGHYQCMQYDGLRMFSREHELVALVNHLSRTHRTAPTLEIDLEFPLDHFAPGYKEPALIADGGFGRVFRVVDPHGYRWALKVLDRSRCASITKELTASHLLCGSPHCLQVENVIGRDGRTRSLKMKLCHHALSTVKQLPVGLCVEVLRQLLLAVRETHSKGLIHRDIKPHNVLLARRVTARSTKQDVHVFLSDYGLSCDVNKAPQDQAGTPSHQAPEIVWGRPYDTRSDMWSVGWVMVELLSGTALRVKNVGEAKTALAKLWDVGDACVFFPSSDSTPFDSQREPWHARSARLQQWCARVKDEPLRLRIIDVLYGLLCFDCRGRLSAQAALDHPLFLNPAKTNHDDENNNNMEVHNDGN